MKFFFIFLLLIPTLAWSYEEVFIYAVSQSDRTFVTRSGKAKGIIEGHAGTFINENVSVVAKAVQCTREYCVWKLDNPHATVPFIQGQIVTYQDAKEYAWTLMPLEKEMKLKRMYLKEPEWSGSVYGGFSRALTESVSGVNSNNIGTKSGMATEVHADYDITSSLEIGPGFRGERQITQSSEATFVTNRMMALFNVKYLFPVITNLYNSQIYGGLTFGMGKTSTSTDTFSQSGTIKLLPSYRLGMKLPVTVEYWFLMEGTIDSLASEETLPDGSIQASNETLAKFMVGIKKYF